MSAVEIKFDCPECGESLAIDRRAIGHEVACPFCKDPIMVPEIAAPAEMPVEPIPLKQEPGPAASLEALASSRPEFTEADVPAVSAKGEEPQSDGEAGAPATAGALPPKRRPGEKPKAMAEGAPSEGGAPGMPMPGRPAPPPPPPGVRTPPIQPPAEVQRAAAPVQQPAGETPAGYEEKVRRKRKRRNPDEHRLNPREHPKMVAFDEVVDQSSFSKRPGHTKTPLLQRLGVIFAILGILGAIWLGILKKKELNEPSSGVDRAVSAPMEIEFEAAKARLNEFRDAHSVAKKMAYVRIPSTNLPGYPTLRERMNDFYTEEGLAPHFPALKRASTSIVEQNGLKFLRILMESKRGGGLSYVYFEKSAGGYSLDWDSFVGYGPQNWSTFLTNISEKSESGIFRLIVEPSDHYSGRFQDENRYRAYEVTDLAEINSAIAYVERGSPAEAVIEGKFKELTSRDDQRALVIGEVKWDERVEGTYLTAMEKVLADSWLVP